MCSSSPDPSGAAAGSAALPDADKVGLVSAGRERRRRDRAPRPRPPGEPASHRGTPSRARWRSAGRDTSSSPCGRRSFARAHRPRARSRRPSGRSRDRPSRRSSCCRRHAGREATAASAASRRSSRRCTRSTSPGTPRRE